MVALTIIGGFLGSGKTTLLNRILADPQGRRFAVIVNDFGDIAIDEDLIASHDGQTIALANGCVCCTIGDNFLRTLLETLRLRPQPDHIVVEASGVADPARIADIAAIEKDLSLDGVIVLADTVGFRTQIADSRLVDTVERQIDCADVVLLNKTDLAENAGVLACRNWIAERRPGVPMVETTQAKAPFDILFGLDANSNKSEHKHHHDLPFETRSFEANTVITKETIESALRDLGPDIVRAKGILNTGNEWAVVQLVGERIDWSASSVQDPEKSRLVIIGPDPLPDIAVLERLFSDS